MRMNLDIKDLLHLCVEEVSKKMDPCNSNHLTSEHVKPPVGVMPPDLWEEKHREGYNAFVRDASLPGFLSEIGAKDSELIRLFSKSLVYEYETLSRKRRYRDLLGMLARLQESNFVALNLDGWHITDVTVTRELVDQSSTIMQMNNLYLSSRLLYLERLFKHIQPSEQTHALFLKLTEKFKRVAENGKDREKSIKEWNEKQNASQVHQDLESQKDIH